MQIHFQTIKCWSVITDNAVYLTIKLELNYMASQTKQLRVHCMAHNRTHDKQRLNDMMGFFLSHQKSRTQARAARDFQWHSSWPRLFPFFCTATPSTVAFVFMFRGQKWPQSLKTSSPRCMQETGGKGQGMMAFCLFPCPNVALLFHTGWTPSSPVCTSYMPAPCYLATLSCKGVCETIFSRAHCHREQKNLGFF